MNSLYRSLLLVLGLSLAVPGGCGSDDPVHVPPGSDVSDDGAGGDDTGEDTGGGPGGVDGGNGDTGGGDAGDVDAEGGDTRDSGDGDTDTGDTSPPVVETSYEVILPAAGGEVDAGDLHFSVPPGAVAEDTPVTITVREGASVEGYTPYSAVHRFEPAGLRFAKSIEVSLPYEGDSFRAAFFWSRDPSDGGGFERVGGRAAAGRVQAPVWHFSEGFVADGVSFVDAPDTDCVRTLPLGLREAQGSGLALFFAVEDCQGRAVAGLQTSDFQILENGTALSPGTPVTALPVEERQVFVTLLLDVSSSMLPVLDDAIAAAERFVGSLESEGLVVYVGVELFAGMADNMHWSGHTLDMDQVRERLGELSGFVPDDPASRNLNGAIIGALENLGGARESLRDRNYGGALTTGFLLAVTNGPDTAGRSSVAEVQAALGESSGKLLILGLEGETFELEQARELGPSYMIVSPGAETLGRDISAIAAWISGRIPIFWATAHPNVLASTRYQCRYVEQPKAATRP